MIYRKHKTMYQLLALDSDAHIKMGERAHLQSADRFKKSEEVILDEFAGLQCYKALRPTCLRSSGYIDKLDAASKNDFVMSFPFCELVVTALRFTVILFSSFTSLLSRLRASKLSFEMAAGIKSQLAPAAGR